MSQPAARANLCDGVTVIAVALALTDFASVTP
jgi:hypothetical protein